MAQPLIHTNQGNLPEADLIRIDEWENSLAAEIVPSVVGGKLEFGARLKGHIVCKPTYYLKNPDGSRGELVRSDAYVYHTGIELGSESGSLN